MRTIDIEDSHRTLFTLLYFITLSYL